MKTRRELLLVSAGFFTLHSLGATAAAWPERAISIVVPFPAGGSADMSARLIADHLQKSLSQTVIVENKPGAGGNLAATSAARAQPDGYVLFIGTNGTQAINGSLYKKLSYDPDKDFVPVALIWEAPNLVVIPPTVPARTLSEFIAYARTNPGKLSFGSSGVGSPTHLAGEMFKALTHTDLTHVPYRGQSAALTDLISSRFEAMFPLLPDVIEHIRSGAVIPLAVASSTRLALLPDVPTAAEAGLPGLSASAWTGFFAPAKTPPAVVDKLEAVVGELIGSSDFKTRMGVVGIDIKSMSRQDFASFIIQDRARWAKVIGDLNVKLD